MNPLHQILSPLSALEKAKKYCAYQERAHSDVRKKLMEWKLTEEQVEWVIAELIQENYLNELRYARAFAEGKFRIKGWGKYKIKYSLRAKGISDYCIAQALESITENYQDMLAKQAAKWLRIHPDKDKQNQKLTAHLLSKGYAYNEIQNYLQTSDDLSNNMS